MIGSFDEVCSSVIDQSRSLKIQVKESAPSAASAGRVSGRITWKKMRIGPAPSMIAASWISCGRCA